MLRGQQVAQLGHQVASTFCCFLRAFWDPAWRLRAGGLGDLERRKDKADACAGARPRRGHLGGHRVSLCHI